MSRTPQHAFASALRFVRESRGFSQESLDTVSGRTYVSALERGTKQPTIGKVADLAGALDVHPLSLLALSFLRNPSSDDVEPLLLRVVDEIAWLRRDGTV